MLKALDATSALGLLALPPVELNPSVFRALCPRLIPHLRRCSSCRHSEVPEQTSVIKTHRHFVKGAAWRKLLRAALISQTPSWQTRLDLAFLVLSKLKKVRKFK